MRGYTCGGLPTPAWGLKMPFHPPEEAAGSESQHICDGSFLSVQFCISLSIVLVFLFVSLTPRPANFLFHVFLSFLITFLPSQVSALHAAHVILIGPIRPFSFTLFFPVSAPSLPPIVTQREDKGG